MNGGYLMVSKDDTKLYEKLTKALAIGKPILWYEDATTCYYIDTITTSGTDIVLTKGGKTITIESDGDVTETGDIQAHLYEYEFDLDDSNGNTYYFNILSSNDGLDEPSKMIEYLSTDNTGFKGFVTGSNYVMHGIDGIDSDGTNFELYSVFDNEAIFGNFAIADLTTITKHKLF